MALIAIVGKPNTGKSTLFNRIAGSRKAVESPIPGTTRDRIFHTHQGKKIPLTFVDTGGISFGEGTFDDEIKKQAEIAIAEADIIVFCLDSKEELTVSDFEVANLLRKKAGQNKIFIALNKADRPLSAEEKMGFYELGFGDENLYEVSAFHNAGIAEMIDDIEKNLLEKGFTVPEKEKTEAEISLALIGRPNVGKSSLVNAFLNEDKLIVSNIPGTTIDSVDFNIKYEGKNYTIIDTAGVRRKTKRERGVESFSVMRSFESLERADVALLVIDSVEGPTHQDQVIAEQILESKAGLIILVNKWDEDEEGRFKNEEDREGARKFFLSSLQNKFPFLSWASVIFVSARERRNLTKIFEIAENIQQERNKKISTPIMNQFLEEIMSKYSLRARGGKLAPKIKFCRQVDVSPPKFAFFMNKPESVHFSSRRYIENRLRETFGFEGTPIVLEFRQK